MDYGNDRGPSWNWQEQVHNHQKELDFSDDTEVALNQEDHSYTFDDDETTTTTPIKACEDLAYHMTADKTLEEQSETRSVHKRRRVLQFEDQPAESSLFSGENLSAILKENVREDPFDEILPEGAHLITGFSDDASPSSFEGLDLHSEEWYSECFNDAETPFIPDDLNLTGLSDLQIDISEYLNVPPEREASKIQKQVTRSSPSVVFKGRKSFIGPSSKLPSSIVYPFAFIKPCGVHGDITIKDINQRIRTPPAKPKQVEEDPPVYQTSAFSGKPVVGKTKIRTEGGRGSITIMRTRG
ncbi:PREDICTED: protein XRI1-like isoform X2 [Tarenaya hassleriana]|uniref:protein XRI1-like isoform X2 n=1 Tax=Tarenaya hassleriana TaxID=28532 RepID=UPI0008FD7688|nr:PREDICTED: protein XRI1-like isoform X2 [Tarenaya hassleriana]